MRYYLDTEFNGYRGALLSLALVDEDGGSAYFVVEGAPSLATDPWVIEHVVPILYDAPHPMTIDVRQFGWVISKFLRNDSDPVIVTDWPDDIRYLCEVLITGPGEMVDIPGLKFEMVRVDAYPDDGSPRLAGAVQHNAWWDAMALRYVLTRTTKSVRPLASLG